MNVTNVLPQTVNKCYWFFFLRWSSFKKRTTDNHNNFCTI